MGVEGREGWGSVVRGWELRVVRVGGRGSWLGVVVGGREDRGSRVGVRGRRSRSGVEGRGWGLRVGDRGSGIECWGSGVAVGGRGSGSGVGS